MLSADYITSLCPRKRFAWPNVTQILVQWWMYTEISTNASFCGQSVGFKKLKLYVHKRDIQSNFSRRFQCVSCKNKVLFHNDDAPKTISDLAKQSNGVGLDKASALQFE
jgi:hypothetical protein